MTKRDAVFPIFGGSIHSSRSPLTVQRHPMETPMGSVVWKPMFWKGVGPAHREKSEADEPHCLQIQSERMTLLCLLAVPIFTSRTPQHPVGLCNLASCDDLKTHRKVKAWRCRADEDRGDTKGQLPLEKDVREMYFTYMSNKQHTPTGLHQKFHSTSSSSSPCSPHHFSESQGYCKGAPGLPTHICQNVACQCGRKKPNYTNPSVYLLDVYR